MKNSEDATSVESEPQFSATACLQEGTKTGSRLANFAILYQQWLGLVSDESQKLQA
jgi:hypothetical protein